MAPVTCGAAIDVPLSTAVAVAEPRYAERIWTPGANRSTHRPLLDHDGRTSRRSVAATVTARGVRAGLSVHALEPEFPAAATTGIPAAMVRSTALSSRGN